MSMAEDEPTAPTDVEWENIVQIFQNMGDAVDRVRPRVPPEQDLPGDDDVADFTSRVEDLTNASNDTEKVAALRDITRWLAQWKF